MTDTATHTFSGRARAPNPDDVYVGGRLRAARLLAGLSQDALASSVGLSFQQIQKYEKGLNRIGASRLQQFAQRLNVPPAYFFDGLAAGSTAAATMPDLRRDHLDMIRDYDRLPATVQRATRALIKSMAVPAAEDADGPLAIMHGEAA